MPQVSLSVHFAALAGVAVLFCSCASSPQVDPQILQAMTSRNVPTSTVDKVAGGSAVGYNDILAMVQRGVPSHYIISYLQSTRKIYNFTYAQLQTLKQAGATPQLLNYLTETQGFYGYAPAKAKSRSDKMQKDAYYNSPLHQDEAPFAYDPPLIDTWYDSGYEESLYSPFSFN